MRARFLNKTSALSQSIRSDTDKSSLARFEMTCAQTRDISWMGSLTMPLTDTLMRESSAVLNERELSLLVVMSVEGVARVFEHAESRFHIEPRARA